MSKQISAIVLKIVLNSIDTVSAIVLKSTDGQLLYNNLDKSALLNNYFSNVFTKDNNNNNNNNKPTISNAP